MTLPQALMFTALIVLGLALGALEEWRRRTRWENDDWGDK